MPPPITETDAKRGILSLMDRGLIPPGAELTLEPSPVKHLPAALHNSGNKDRMKIPSPGAGIIIIG